MLRTDVRLVFFSAIAISVLFQTIIFAPILHINSISRVVFALDAAFFTTVFFALACRDFFW